MSAIKRINKKVWIALIIGLVIQLLFDPLSPVLNKAENIQARMGIPNARVIWEENGITDYSFRFKVLQPYYIPNKMRVEVRNGEVVQIYPILLESDILEEEPLPPTEWKASNNTGFFDDYAKFTIPQIMTEVESSLTDIYQISIDYKYGFISSVGFGKPNSWGLLSRKISHCCRGFEIYDFQVLDE